MFNIEHLYIKHKKVDHMTIYFNEMPTQRNARGISERIDDRMVKPR